MAFISSSIANQAFGDLKPSPKPLHASFNYYAAPTAPKLNDVSVIMGGSTQTSSVILPVTDLRHLPHALSSYNHEKDGFQILYQKLPIDNSHASIHDENVMRSQYYPAISSLLKGKLGVRSTAIVNTTTRDGPPPSSISYAEYSKGGPASPFFISHTDYTAPGSRAHLRAMTTSWVEGYEQEDPGTDQTGSQTSEERAEFFRLRDEIIAAEDEAIRKAGLNPSEEDIMSGKGGHWDWDGKGYTGPRYAIFSVWRPLEIVQRDPLAIIVAPESHLEYTTLPRTYAGRKGYVKEYYSENPILRPPPKGQEEKHKWCYLSEQKPEEVYAIKLYDSEVVRRGGGKVRHMCPHSAFKVEGTEDLPTRRSCEVRVWCIW